MVDYRSLPPGMVGGAQRYIEHGIKPGDFLCRVFSNDLVGAYSRADNINTAAMRTWAAFLYNEAPRGCWGSEEAMADWIKAGGLNKIEG